MNKRVVAVLLLTVVVGVFFVIACSKSPSKDSSDKQTAKGVTVSGGIPPATDDSKSSQPTHCENKQFDPSQGEKGIDCGGNCLRNC